MKTSRKSQAICVGAFVVMLLLSGAGTAQAQLKADMLMGYVEQALEGEGNWSELLQEQLVGPGQSVRTDMSAAADLTGTDGSLFFLGELTELLVNEFEYVPESETRIVHVSLLEGSLTAEAAHYEYANNIFDVETPTVVGSFKFTKGSFNVDPEGNTNATMYTGKFDFDRENKQAGAVSVEASLVPPAEQVASLAQTTPEPPQPVLIVINLPNSGNITSGLGDGGFDFVNNGETTVTMSIGGNNVSVPAGGSINASADPAGGGVTVTNTGSVPVTVNSASVGAGASQSAPVSQGGGGQSGGQGGQGGQGTQGPPTIPAMPASPSDPSSGYTEPDAE